LRRNWSGATDSDEQWRNRFAQLIFGPGLENEPRRAGASLNDESVERRILDQLAKAPPQMRALEMTDWWPKL